MAYDAQGHKLTTYRGEIGYWVDDEEEPYFVRAEAVSSTPPIQVSATAGGQVRPGGMSNVDNMGPSTWAELMRYAPPPVDQEMIPSAPQNVSREVPGLGRVQFSLGPTGEYKNATVLDPTAKDGYYTLSPQADGSIGRADTHYNPSIGSLGWLKEAATVGGPVLAAFGANALQGAGMLGGAGGTAGATGAGDLAAWELGMSGGAPAGATGGAGALAGTPYAGLAGSSGGALTPAMEFYQNDPSVVQNLAQTQAPAPAVNSVLGGAGINSAITGAAAGTAAAGLTPAQVATAQAAAPTVAGGAGMLDRVLSGAGTASDFLALGLPLAGAALGGMSANGDPAGTTTTVQDLPDWLKPYVTGNLDAAKAYMDANPQDNSLLAPASAELNKTIAGDYLNSNPANPFYTGAMNYTNSSMDYLRPTAEGQFLNANPYIDAMYAKARDAVGAGVDSRFSLAGRYGSGAHQGVLGTTFNNLATDIYGNNYATERANMLSAGTTLTSAEQAQQAARLAGASGLAGNYNTARNQQLTAATSAPGFTADAATSPFAAFNAFGNLTKGLGVGQTTSPYFTNPTAGALSGALAGYGLSKAFA